ncbi:MAG TPA: type II toxin-antitoxin system VapC family toxin [Segetibacter sp.]|nr:type II toxin-antitoxin system VapC family toxin [Segetibacter sp.]
MGKEYLIDTNGVIDFLRKAFSEEGMSFLASVIDNIPNISVITKIELLSFNAPLEEASILEDFVINANVYELQDDIIEETIRLRKQIKIKVPDGIIAATALINNMTLITRNTNDFKGIAKLKTVNLHKAIPEQ